MRRNARGVVNMQRFTFALRGIKTGEELTADYSKYSANK
jgi:hypothetical protein